MNVQSVINRIRLKITDEDKYRFSDDEVIVAINEAIRFVAENIISNLPELLSVEEESIIEAGENVIEIQASPVRILEVRVGRKSLHCVNFHQIMDPDAKGQPTVFVIAGAKKLKAYPIPNEKMLCTISLVPTMPEMVAITDEVPIQEDLIDSVIEFAAMRLSLVDEFDETMETQLVSVLENKIQSKLGAYVPTSCFVKSYW